ncbi:DUF4870 domain-containing protein [Flavobacteriaceae bacterium S356]|uniref:DUF4870 domain-containing protein n=1 Tax=Asprobacillus argus TaxID=3076534 RepID=A0ABU3LHK3_9FLAO|nr:DUF4870 domain-containing protein [Flavobacteriaceae bacterium S356]
MKHNNENTNAFLIHISALAGFVFPFGSIILPLVLWQSLKDRSQFLDQQGKEAVNFNISYTLYIFIISITAIPFFIGRIFKNNWNYDHSHWDWSLNISDMFGIFGFASFAGIIGLIQLALIILAAIKANKGEAYKYPFTIKFIK